MWSEFGVTHVSERTYRLVNLPAVSLHSCGGAAALEGAQTKGRTKTPNGPAAELVNYSWPPEAPQDSAAWGDASHHLPTAAVDHAVIGGRKVDSDVLA